MVTYLVSVLYCCLHQVPLTVLSFGRKIGSVFTHEKIVLQQTTGLFPMRILEASVYCLVGCQSAKYSILKEKWPRVWNPSYFYCGVQNGHPNALINQIIHCEIRANNIILSFLISLRQWTSRHYLFHCIGPRRKYLAIYTLGNHNVFVYACYGCTVSYCVE
jgi:hypothetical protein